MLYGNPSPHYHSIAERRAQSPDDPQIKKLHAALAPYIDLQKLRDLAAQSEDLYAALRCDNPPEEVLDLVRLLATILRPKQRERIRSPADAAALLMVEMGHLDQEELRTVLLNTKNHVVGIVTIYRGRLIAHWCGSAKSTSLHCGEIAPLSLSFTTTPLENLNPVLRMFC